jgi:ligand-binding sensor domain-containing protein
LGSTKDEKTIKIKKGVWRTYDATDGLPGEPYHLLQDRQGYLWIGTSTGLCRYDGTEFTTCTADALAGRWIHALCEDPQGRLWFKGARLLCFDGDQFINKAVTEKLAGKYAKPLCIDNQGKLWIGTLGHGIFCFDGSSFTKYSSSDGLWATPVFDIMEDREGHRCGLPMVNMWVCHALMKEECNCSQKNQ